MPTINLLARVALACVFAVSGVAKLLDRQGTAQAVSGFGVPRRWVGPVAAALPLVELLIALLLLPDPAASPGLVLALVVLVCFTGAVLYALHTGRQVECHCFGRIGGADVSRRTVARNTVLLALALAGLQGSGDGEAHNALAVGLGILVAAGLIGAEGWTGRLARERKQRADDEAFERSMMSETTDAVPAPGFRLPTLTGQEWTLESLTSGGRPALLVFMMPGCGPCHAMHPAVARWADAYQKRLSVAVVSRYDAAANEGAYDDVPDLRVLLDADASVTRSFGVVGTPSAVLIGPDGFLRGGVAAGERLVRRLLAVALAGDDVDAGHPPAGDGAPADTIGLDTVPVPSPTVSRHDADGAVLLADDVSGAGATLDPIGGVVWSVIDGASSLREIVRDLSEEFDAPEEVVGPDVVAMVQSLGRAGLLVGIAAEPSSDDVDPLSSGDREGSAPR